MTALLPASAVHALTSALLALLATAPPPPAARLAPTMSAAVRADLLARGYTAVPMERYRVCEHRFVTMRVNDQPLRMIVDTGCPVTTVEPHVAARLKLPHLSEGQAGFVRATVPATLTLFARYDIGGVAGGDFQAAIADITKGVDAGPARTLMPFDGLIGYDLLIDHAAHIDLASDTLYLLPTHHAEAVALGGDWKCIGVHKDTLAAPEDAIGDVSMTFVGENVSLRGVSEGAMHFVATANTAPAVMTMYQPATKDDGTKTIRSASGYYKIDGETLIFCMPDEAKEGERVIVPPDLKAGPNWTRYEFRRKPGTALPKPPQAKTPAILATGGYTTVATLTGKQPFTRMVPIRIAGIETNVALDTGANKFTVSVDVADRCDLIVADRPETVADDRGQANITRLNVGGLPCGWTPLAVARFQPNFRHAGLLGLDFLTAHAAHIDCATHTLYLLPRNHGANLSGKWVCDSGESHDGPISAERCAAIFYEFEQNRVRFRTKQVDEQFHFIADTQYDPRHLTSVRPSIPGRPESIPIVLKSVYRLTGDRLTICTNHTTKNTDTPPMDFKPTADWVVFHLKRVNPAAKSLAQFPGEK